MTDARTVRLGELDYDPVEIPGQAQRLKQLDDLLGSIPAKGLLQSLNVRPRADGVAGWWVKAGKRRLAVLRKLRDDAGAIQGVTVTDDYPVGVIVQDEDDNATYETSVAENLQRLPPTVVEEVRAIARMAETAPPRQIASHFGITEKRVKQRLVLAQLHPDVLQALDENKITIAAAEAFTIQPDPEKQAAYLKKSNSSYQLYPEQIRSAFTQKLVRGDSPVAKLIGKAAYKAAGGEVLGDLFDDKSYWISTKLIDQLLEQHWEKQIAAWKEEGWGFVETAEQYCGNSRWKIYSSDRLKKGEDSAEDKAGAGVVYFPNGSEEPIVGIKRFVEGRSSGGYKPVASLDHPPGELKKMLLEPVERSLQERVAASPTLALQLLIATLRSNVYGGLLDVDRQFSIDANDDDEEPDQDFDQVIDALATLSLDELLAELCRVLAQGVDLPYHGKLPGRFMELAGVTTTFDADAYFKELTKPYLDLVWDDMTDPSAGEKKDKKLKGKTSEVLAKVKQRAADTGWLPPQLRTPSYTGPHFLDLQEESDTDEDEEFTEDELQAAE